MAARSQCFHIQYHFEWFCRAMRIIATVLERRYLAIVQTRPSQPPDQTSSIIPLGYWCIWLPDIKSQLGPEIKTDTSEKAFQILPDLLDKSAIRENEPKNRLLERQAHALRTWPRSISC